MADIPVIFLLPALSDRIDAIPIGIPYELLGAHL
jgi:hypothetical protein